MPIKPHLFVMMGDAIDSFLENDPSDTQIKKILLKPEMPPRLMFLDINQQLEAQLKIDKENSQKKHIRNAIQAQKKQDREELSKDNQEKRTDDIQKRQTQASVESLQKEIIGIERFITVLKQSKIPEDPIKQQDKQRQLTAQHRRLEEKRLELTGLMQTLKVLDGKQTRRETRALQRQERYLATKIDKQLTPTKYQQLKHQIQTSYKTLDSTYQEDKKTVADQLFKHFLSHLEDSRDHQHLEPLCQIIHQVIEKIEEIKTEKEQLIKTETNLKRKRTDQKTMQKKLDHFDLRKKQIPHEQNKLQQAIAGINRFNNSLLTAEIWLGAGALLLSGAAATLMLTTAPSTVTTGFIIASITAISLCALNLIVMGINMLRRQYKQSTIAELTQELSDNQALKIKIEDNQLPDCKQFIESLAHEKSDLEESIRLLTSEKNEWLTQADTFSIPTAESTTKTHHGHGLFESSGSDVDCYSESSDIDPEIQYENDMQLC